MCTGMADLPLRGGQYGAGEIEGGEEYRYHGPEPVAPNHDELLRWLEPIRIALIECGVP